MRHKDTNHAMEKKGYYMKCPNSVMTYLIKGQERVA
jgi:hypothetical protein